MPSVENRKKNPLKWRKYMREYMQTNYRKQSMIRSVRKYRTKLALARAAESGELRAGWPDASQREVKIGQDTLSPWQLRRFAWLKSVHGIDVRVEIADSHEDLHMQKESFQCFPSVSEYLKFIDSEFVLMWERVLIQASSF